MTGRSTTQPPMPNPYWTYQAWTLYFLTFLETAGFVFYYLGWMNNSVFTVSPVALMVLTIVQTGIYLLGFGLFVFGIIPVAVSVGGAVLNKKEKATWEKMINYHYLAHSFVAFIGATLGMVMAYVNCSYF